MPSIFDQRINFNGEVFAQLIREIPDLRRATLLESGAVYGGDENIKTLLNEQHGGNYAVRIFHGEVPMDADNYDGVANITTSKESNFSQGVIVVGRAHGFTEKDFTTDISGQDPVNFAAERVGRYWSLVDNKDIFSALKGVLSVSALSTHVLNNVQLSADTIIDVTRGIWGDNSDIVRLTIMHSKVAAVLEKAKLLEFAKYTLPNGLEIPTNLAYWGGRRVLVDDSMPVEDGTDNKKIYTSYVLGERSILWQDVGTKVPFEFARDPLTAGGQETFVTRARHALAFAGVSFKANSTTTASPTVAELATGSKWELVKNADGVTTIDPKAIPFGAFKVEF